MFDHITLGTNNVPRSIAFYDAVLAPLGLKQLYYDGDGAGAYGCDHPQFWLVHPLDESRPASIGNGTHVAFVAPSRAAVEAFHAVALAAGADDAGKPGLRTEYDPDYYAAFVLDPDGHKIEAVNRSVNR
jgi:catechol 2,3-dioxygenase-like lactoylglutathione lyase family enzyme